MEKIYYLFYFIFFGYSISYTAFLYVTYFKKQLVCKNRVNIEGKTINLERSRAILEAMAINALSAYVMRLRRFTELTLGPSKLMSSTHKICQQNLFCLGKERNY